MAQDHPFSSIPPSPKNFSASNSICRMIQGLGFRYHWATEGLRAEDLEYRPSDEAQSTLSTIQHIYSLSKTILNAAKNKVSEGPKPIPPDRLDELRAATLDYLQESAELFLNYNEDELYELNIIFERGGKQSKFPIWNLINGPISDALYHTGQVVSFRRTSGNPISKGVNVFLGVKN
ncbi:hypothetical protein N9N15_01195 [Flavobacteriaceae bacterium]|nr:hypothetical protein [Flavobacteriaceae bacterium]